MQHQRHGFHFWKPSIPRDTFIDWSILDCCVEEIQGNTWVSIVPNIKGGALSNLNHPKSTAPVLWGVKGDQFQRPWKPSAGELPEEGEEATSSLLTWLILRASWNPFKTTDFEFQCIFLLSSFLLVLSHLRASHMGREWVFAFRAVLLHPWLLGIPQAVTQKASEDAARKESFEESGGEKAGDSSSQVSDATNEISPV